MFKYSAFTENTPEMREWLEKIGYRMEYKHSASTNILFVNNGTIYETNEGYPSYNLMINEGHINCLGNPNLFKAVTAIRECPYSAYLRWFTDGEDWILWEGVETKMEMSLDLFNELYHMASLKELVEHFKKTER